MLSTIFLTSAFCQDEPSESRIFFKSGGSILGRIIAEPKEDRKSYVVIKTASGSDLKVEKSRVIQRVSPNTRADKEYLRLLESMQNTPDGHWKVYNWCKQNSSRFAEQVDYHLRQIVALDSSDEKAWQLLNHIEVDGRWVPEEQHYLSRGYVKHKGRWVSKLQLEFDTQVDSSDNELNIRKKSLRNWKQNTIKNKDFETIKSELFGIIDPVSVGYFTEKFLDEEKDPQRRLLYIEAIGNVNSRFAHRVLVKYAMEDPVSEVREHALLQLEKEQFSRAYTSQRLARYLTHPNNRWINRAGFAMGNFKDRGGIIPLISSLTTTHKIATGNNPDGINTSFDSTGGIGFSAGGSATVDRTLSNEGVLHALNEITDQDFSFDADLWREWYIINHTITDPGLREDFDK